VLDDAAQQRLLSHYWPGNVRELDNVLQRALILQSGQTITADDIAFGALTGQQEQPASIQVDKTIQVDSAQDLRSQEQRHIIDVLEKNNGSRRLSAKELGISERTLRYKIARFREQGIDIPEKIGKKSA